MTEEQQQIDWREDVQEASGTLKIAGGETKKFVFLSEGEKRTHQDFGTSVVFSVEHEGQTLNFYVRENNFALLKQIKELGVLTGTLVEVSRTGEKKSDTRYSIQKL